MSAPRPPRPPRINPQVSRLAGHETIPKVEERDGLYGQDANGNARAAGGADTANRRSGGGGADAGDLSETAGEAAVAGADNAADATRRRFAGNSLGKVRDRIRRSRKTEATDKRGILWGRRRTDVDSAPAPSSDASARKLVPNAVARSAGNATHNKGIEILSGSHDQVADLRARAREKRRARWTLILYRLAAALAVIAVVAAGIWVVWFSPIFALNANNLTITGSSDDFDDSAVVAQVEAQAGIPLLRVDLAAIEAAAAEDPAVLEAEASLDWPTGVQVEITRRVPVFAVEHGSTYDYVATDGVTVSSGNASVGDLLILSMDGYGTDRAAEQIELAVAVYSNLGEDLLEQVESLKVTGRSVSLLLTSGATVVWGTEADSDLKGQILDLLVAEVSASTYDVSDPSRPVTTD